MRAETLRALLEMPAEQQQEWIRMQEELDRLQAQNDNYRAQLALHYDEMLARVSWWRKLGMRLGYWLHTASMPKWFYGVEPR